MRVEAQLGKKKETKIQVRLHKGENKISEEKITLEIILKVHFF